MPKLIKACQKRKVLNVVVSPEMFAKFEEMAKVSGLRRGVLADRMIEGYKEVENGK